MKDKDLWRSAVASKGRTASTCTVVIMMLALFEALDVDLHTVK
jgi:hypothetical protein